MQTFILEQLNRYNLAHSNLIAIALVVLIIALITLFSYMVFQKVVLSILNKFSHKNQQTGLINLLLKHKIFKRLVFTLQGVLVVLLTRLWLQSDHVVHDVMILAANLWILLFSTLTLFAIFDAILDVTFKNGIAKRLPIRGLLQSLKIVIAALMAIMMISMLIGRSPVILLSGLGAMTAVLMLVFKDPILGLVAGFQLSMNKMLNVGDWLEMPKYGADGEVTDITLTTVKVKNWDNTITTIPTYTLIADSFKNWQGMAESGGRRIKRSIFIDTTSVHFLTEEELNRLKQVQLLQDYLNKKQQEVEQFNQQHNINMQIQVNGRRLTNLGTFRAYIEAYLRAHPSIHQEMTLMARQMAPTENGIPLEVYAFTNTTQWLVYESIQSDIFDHLFAIIGEFNLRVHQTPTGNDMRSIGHANNN